MSSAGDAWNAAAGTLPIPGGWGLGLLFGIWSFHWCSLVWQVRASAVFLRIFRSVCVCTRARVCVRARNQKLDVTDVRKIGLPRFTGRDAWVGAQCRLWPRRSIGLPAVAYTRLQPTWAALISGVTSGLLRGKCTADWPRVAGEPHFRAVRSFFYLGYGLSFQVRVNEGGWWGADKGGGVGGN